MFKDSESENNNDCGERLKNLRIDKVAFFGF